MTARTQANRLRHDAVRAPRPRSGPSWPPMPTPDMRDVDLLLRRQAALASLAGLFTPELAAIGAS